MSQKAILTALVLTTLVIVVLASLFDSISGFVYLPRFLIAIGASAAVVPFARVWRNTALLCSAIIFVVVMGLSFVRWNNLKSFYIDAYSLSAEMTMDEVRTRMAPYLEVGRSDTSDVLAPADIFTASPLGVDETAAEHESRIIFIPDDENFADWCIVYADDGIVNRVEIHPD